MTTIRPIQTGQEDVVTALFSSAFTDSESETEGQSIGNLVSNILADNTDDLLILTATEGNDLVASVIFSPMHYSADDRKVFILSPLAVTTKWQRRGIGQAIISHGLQVLRARGVDVVLTYGNPAYYGRTGFKGVSTALVPAPFPLTYPHGWLGQSLSSETLSPLKGKPSCIAALSDPSYW